MREREKESEREGQRGQAEGGRERESACLSVTGSNLDGFVGTFRD